MKKVFLITLVTFFINDCIAQNSITANANATLARFDFYDETPGFRPPPISGRDMAGITSQMNQAQINNIATRFGEFQSADGAVNNGFSTMSGWIDGFNDVKDLWNSTASLDEGECAPDFTTSGAAQMQRTCNSNAACEDCYSKAVEKMDFFRRQLGRLNCIYTNTTSFSSKAISFGDAYSGFHAMSAAAWQNQKAQILKSLTQLKGTYDRKYIEFIQGLMGALMEFDACENTFGSGDWFAKSGFIYFEFMKERYKRKD